MRKCAFSSLRTIHFSTRCAMDCFAEPVIGRRFAPTRWLAMTILNNACPLPFGFTLLRRLLRYLRSHGPRLGQADSNGLLAALDLAAGAAALQRAGLALLHRAADLGGGLLGILSCHDISPDCGKIIFADVDGSPSDSARLSG